MNNLKRYYNQNRKKIWGIIIIIAFAFVLLQLANGIAKNNNKKKIEQAKTNISNTTSTNQNTIETNALETSPQGGQETKASANTQTSTIEQFLNYCNNKELEKAYEMLTNECKEQMFNNIETFEHIYYTSTFENKPKEFSIEKWVNNTYMIKINESSLALGKASKDNQKVDYITPIKDENSNYKLNINSFIGYNKINAKKEQDGIEYEVVGRNRYLNYEEYIINVTNNALAEIELDPLDTTRSLYIEDNNGAIYSAYKHELTKEMLTISRGHTRQLNIKFYSTYSSNKSIKYLVFGQTKKANQLREVRIDL